MRILVLTLLLSFGAAAGSAQDRPTGTRVTAEPGLVPEPHAMTNAIESVNRLIDAEGSTAKDGFYPALNGMVTGAGWISAGPGYRRHFLDGHALVDASAALSWRAYKLAQARFELTDLAHDRVTVGTQVRWQDLTQVNYFGIGASSLESRRSEYRLKDTDVLGYGEIKANSWLSVGGRFGWLKKPRLSSSNGPFDRDFPDALQVFELDPGVVEPTSFLHGDVSITADTRDHPDHPTTGGLYRAAAGTYSDRDLGQFSFRRYEAEAVQLVPVVGQTWVVALHGWGVFSDTSAGDNVPFYMLPSLGGGNTLRSYHDYRFHDRNLLLASAESRFALFSHVDAAVFIDAGNVASRAGDLDLKKTSYGTGLRLHTRTSTIGRVEVAHGHEGWLLFVKLSDPFGLARRSERATVVPFVP
jgi:hypothetical protein